MVDSSLSRRLDWMFCRDPFLPNLFSNPMILPRISICTRKHGSTNILYWSWRFALDFSAVTGAAEHWSAALADWRCNCDRVLSHGNGALCYFFCLCGDKLSGFPCAIATVGIILYLEASNQDNFLFWIRRFHRH